MNITIARPESSLPILVATGRESIGIRAGTVVYFGEKVRPFPEDTALALDALKPGTDYAVTLDKAGAPVIMPADAENPIEAGAFAGFHFAPGGNAVARAGGDAVPAINPFSIWDVGSRPVCPDPRGMTLAGKPGGHRSWVDIYLLGADHDRYRTSRYGVEIADGRSLDLLDYPTAVNILAGNGKRLLTYDEFRIAAFGVTEKSAADRDPKTTGLDAPRTSRFGLMQATGNLWVWGTDGDPDDPRPSVFGGSWIRGSNAGSRCAALVRWPGISRGPLSARGACDHLVLA